MIAWELVIAGLSGIGGGLFAWLLVQRVAPGIRLWRERLASSTESRFAEMFLFIDVDRYLNLYLLALVALPLLVWLVSRQFLLGLLTLLVAVTLPYLLISHLYQKRLRTFEQQLPDAMLMLSGSLRAGSSITTALDGLIKESEPPLSQEFSLLLREIRLGVDMETALEHMEQRIHLEDFRLLLSAIRISRDVGGNLAETLESLAATLRHKLVMEGKIRSLTAQGRLQGIVMSLLPVGLVLVLFKLEPDTMGLLFTTRLGWVVVGLIAAMQLLGYITIRKITRIEI